MNINISTLGKREYYEKFLRIVSALAPRDKQLTEAEILVLSLFMDLPESFKYHPFSPKARKLVVAQLPRQYTVQNMSIKICNIIDKGYLYRDEDNIVDYSPAMKEILNSKSLNVSLSYRSPDSKDSSST